MVGYFVYVCLQNTNLFSLCRLMYSVFNHVFAFSWDIVMDWGLVEIGKDGVGLRQHLHFKDPFVYIMAVGLNGIMRLVKVASHFHPVVHHFCFDLSEIGRRWIWVIFRFENEWIKVDQNENTLPVSTLFERDEKS